MHRIKFLTLVFLISIVVSMPGWAATKKGEGSRPPVVKQLCAGLVRVTVKIDKDIPNFRLVDPISKKIITQLKKDSTLELSVPEKIFEPLDGKKIGTSDLIRVGLSKVLDNAYSLSQVENGKRVNWYFTTIEVTPDPAQRAGQQGFANLDAASSQGALRLTDVFEIEKVSIPQEEQPSKSRRADSEGQEKCLTCETKEHHDGIHTLQNSQNELAKKIIEEYSNSDSVNKMIHDAIANAADRRRFVSYWSYQGVPIHDANNEPDGLKKATEPSPCTKTGSCYAYVKYALINSGIIDQRITGELAIEAKDKLKCLGFENILKNPKSNENLEFSVTSDMDAPRGSIVVYSRAPTAKEPKPPGHIAIKLGDHDLEGYTYVSDFLQTPDAVPQPPFKLVGVYIRKQDYDKKYKWSELSDYCK